MVRPVVIPAVLLFAATLRAGTLATTDGESLTGTIKKTDDGWTVTSDDGKARLVPARKVKSIKFGGDESSAPGRELAGLKSLRRSVEFSDDLPKIVDRYRTFIDQTKTSSVLEQARQDLAVWQDRLDRQMVKVGKTWGTPAERDARTRALRQQAEQARLSIKSDRFREAEHAVADLLDQDPQNVSGLYLAGVLAQKRQDLGEAKKDFLAVQQALPQHAPTLLNLAIVLLRQKQWGGAYAAMEQALTAAPGVQALLDTAAEFVNAMPPDTRRSAAAQKLVKTFLAEDAELQKRMAARRLHRWGATWIDDTTFAKLRQADEEVKKKQVDLQKQFDDATQQVKTIDDKAAANAKAMDDIAANSYTRTSEGKLVRLPLPRLWYDLQAENASLKGQREQAAGKLDSVRDEARKTQAMFSTPTYTGVLTPVGEDGVPLAVLPDDPPATAPAPPPASQPATAPENVIRIGPP